MVLVITITKLNQVVIYKHQLSRFFGITQGFNEINKEVHQHGSVNFMAGLAVGAVLNLVNKVPKASYYEDENF